jgi:hypothetical protein
VPQHIGNAGAKAVAWVEHIVLSAQAKRTKELKEFAERLRSLFDPGEPLDVTSRRLMEPFLGYDLQEVRIHHGQKAEEASRRLGARAFTFRGHVFAPRQNLDGSTTEGLGLLAHELTHVIQQTQPRSCRKVRWQAGTAVLCQQHRQEVALAPRWFYWLRLGVCP